MKKLSVFILLGLFFSSPIYPNSLFTNLLRVNKNWQFEKNASLFLFDRSDAPRSNTEWISTHLSLVEEMLSNRSTERLSQQQQQKRSFLLKHLNSYWKAGRFPVNDYQAYQTPVFIDRNGTHCAVGYLMQKSGAEWLAREIDATEKFAYVTEIKNKHVAKWAQDNGFTIDELALIQPGYPVSCVATGLDDGLNAAVYDMVEVPSHQNALFAVGAFTAATKGNQCSFIGQYISGFAGYSWIAVNSGLNDTARCLLADGNKLYIGGKFTKAGTMTAEHIICYDIQKGQWESVGALDGDVYALKMYRGELYAGGKFTGYVAKWTGTKWEVISQGMFAGEGVRALEVWKDKLYIGGNFTLATGVHRQHVIAFNGTQIELAGIGTSAPINDFEVWRDSLYAGCEFVSGSDSAALVIYSEGSSATDWRKVDVFALSKDASIKKLHLIDQSLIAVGSLFVENMMDMGSNIAKIELAPNYWHYAKAVAYVDAPIHCAIKYNAQICIGGNFTSCYSGLSTTTPLKHIGLISNVKTGIQKYAAKECFEIFPNPFSSTLSLDFSKAKPGRVYRICISDVFGRELYRNNFTVNASERRAELSLGQLAKGSYIVRIAGDEGSYSTAVVKME